MKLTASKTAINVIATYCNKHSIAFEQQNNNTISFEKVTIPVYLIILNWIAQGLWGSDAAALLISTDLASSAFFFLFGDRVYLKYKSRS